MAKVYANESQDRFFQIPDDATLPAGPLVLRTLSGGRLEVDEAAATAFEIPEALAKALVKEEVAGFARKAAGALSSLGGILSAVGQGARPAPRDPAAPPQVLAESLGLSPEALRTDPDAVAAGFKHLLDGLRDTAIDALRDAPEARVATRQRIDAFVSGMGSGAPAPEDLEKLLESVRTALGDPALEARIRAASDKLDAATRRLREEGKALLDEADET